MIRRVRTADACRACGLDGRTYYSKIMGVAFPLCEGCLDDYERAETACGVRVIQREKTASRGGLLPKPSDPASGTCSECDGNGVCAECSGTGETIMECTGCGTTLMNSDVATDPENTACSKCLADDEQEATENL